jgi:hypothetical protein
VVRQKREDSANSDALEVWNRILKLYGKGEGSREDTCAELQFKDEQSMEKGTYEGPGRSIIYAAIRCELYRGWLGHHCLKRLKAGVLVQN